MMENIIELKKITRNQDKLLSNQSKIIDGLGKQIQKQNHMIHKLQDRCDSLEQALHKDKAVLSGPAITPFMTGTPVTNEKLAETLNETLKIPDDEKVKTNIVKYTRRLNAKKLLVVFHSEVPQVIYKRIKDSDKQMFVSDFLTRTRSNILYRLRQLRDEPGSLLTVVTSRNGRPAFKVKNDDRFQYVETPQKFNDLFVTQDEY